MIDLGEADEVEAEASLSASVGEGGGNRAPDVLTIQRLLNSIDPSAGGPHERLEEDGQCGSRTKSAILRFQQTHVPQLLADGRVDPDKNTWKKLRQLTGSNPRAITGTMAAAPGASSVSEATQTLFTGYLYLSRWRVFEAIRCIDLARNELDLLNIRSFMLPRVTFMQAYVEAVNNTTVQTAAETIQVDRCFKFLMKDQDRLNMTITYGQAISMLAKIRAVYATMVEVIVKNSITTVEDEKSGKSNYLRVVPQVVLDNAHTDYGPNGVLADATLGGWNSKDARQGRIRYGSAHIESPAAFSTLIHELAHYVSSASTYMIGDHGYYHKAFAAAPYYAIRNAESYSWYALLASHASLRSLPDNQLPINL